MEISKLSQNTVKIKGKNASVVIDPTGKTEAQIIIITQPEDALDLERVEGQRLMISGPGEYEAGGVSITGKRGKSAVMYLILDTSKILFTVSDDISEIPDDEEYDCLLIKVTGELSDDAFASIHATCTILYGDLSMLKIKSENQEKAVKVSLKKTSEITGKIFLFE